MFQGPLLSFLLQQKVVGVQFWALRSGPSRGALANQTRRQPGKPLAPRATGVSSTLRLSTRPSSCFSTASVDSHTVPIAASQRHFSRFCLSPGQSCSCSVTAFSVPSRRCQIWGTLPNLRFYAAGVRARPLAIPAFFFDRFRLYSNIPSRSSCLFPR